jgi:hypothetical protein
MQFTINNLRFEFILKRSVPQVLQGRTLLNAVILQRSAP